MQHKTNKLNKMSYKPYYKAAVIPWVYVNNNIYYLLGRAHIGGFGYLGGTSEMEDITVEHTAAREFVEEGKCLLNITDITTKLESITKTNIIHTTHKNINYTFYVIPWTQLSHLNPFEYIKKWNNTQIHGDKYNEKVELALVKHDNVGIMAHTVKMVIRKINSLTQNELFSIENKITHGVPQFNYFGCCGRDIYLCKSTRNFDKPWRSQRRVC